MPERILARADSLRSVAQLRSVLERIPRSSQSCTPQRLPGAVVLPAGYSRWAVHEVLAMIRNVLLVVALIPTVLFLLAVLVAKLRDAFEPRWVTVAVAAAGRADAVRVPDRHRRQAPGLLPADLTTPSAAGSPIATPAAGSAPTGALKVQIRAGQGQAYRPTTTPAWVTATSTTSNWVPDDHFDQGGCAVGRVRGRRRHPAVPSAPVPQPGMELTRGVIAWRVLRALIGAPLGTWLARQ